MSAELFEFEGFPKMPRLTKTMVVTEKIDGTNAQVVVEDIGPSDSRNGYQDPETALAVIGYQGRDHVIRAGSRKRFLTRETDNFGFAKFVQENAHELVKLGEGRHFGEWWGSGINKRYGDVLPKGEKRFSLFNVGRWIEDPRIKFGDDVPERVLDEINTSGKLVAPACCRVVPVLLNDYFSLGMIHMAMHDLEVNGSYAAPGCMRPEGVVVFYEGVLFKHTFEFPFGKWSADEQKKAA